VSLPFTRLRQLKEDGLSYSVVLVLAYLEANGYAPIGKIADACGISIRSTERAVAMLKERGLIPNPQNLAHDHDIHGSKDKGTAPTLTDSDGGYEPAVASQDAANDDPLRRQLLDYEVLPWCAAQVLQKIEQGELRREDVERQLGYHQLRLDSGFKFKSHPARFLFSAILKNYAPPAEAQCQAPHIGGNVASVAPQRAHMDRPFGAATLKRRAEFEVRERERQDAEFRRRSLLAMFAGQCRPERGSRRKTPEQLIPQLEKHGLSLAELIGAIARLESEACPAAVLG
jgi:Winged helix-turn-helix DNA-binding